MSKICECPLSSELTDIDNYTCGDKFGQIFRIAFQRKDAGGVLPVFDGSTNNDITIEADWNARLTATDESKIVITPWLNNFIIPRSTAVFTGGGDNTTAYGLPEYQGEGNVSVIDLVLNNLPSEVQRQLDKLTCYSLPQNGESNLWAYLFNESGKIINIDNNGLFEGIPVYNVSLSSVDAQGLNADNKHFLGFDLVNSPDKWDLYSQITTPTFNPLKLT